jgi:hypothetical protein
MFCRCNKVISGLRWINYLLLTGASHVTTDKTGKFVFVAVLAVSYTYYDVPRCVIYPIPDFLHLSQSQTSPEWFVLILMYFSRSQYVE